MDIDGVSLGHDHHQAMVQNPSTQRVFNRFCDAGPLGPFQYTDQPSRRHDQWDPSSGALRADHQLGRRLLEGFKVRRCGHHDLLKAWAEIVWALMMFVRFARLESSWDPQFAGD